MAYLQSMHVLLNVDKVKDSVFSIFPKDIVHVNKPMSMKKSFTRRPFHLLAGKV